MNFDNDCSDYFVFDLQSLGGSRVLFVDRDNSMDIKDFKSGLKENLLMKVLDNFHKKFYK